MFQVYIQKCHPLLRQLFAVLYKNTKLKLKNSLSIIVSILIPIVVTSVLTYVDLGTYRYPNCILKQNKLPLTGYIPFLADFVCNFNNSCDIIEKQEVLVDWEKLYNVLNDFVYFWNSIGPINILSYASLILRKQEIMDLLTRAQGAFAPISELMYQASLKSDQLEAIKVYLELLCGKHNDLSRLIDIFKHGHINVLFGMDRVSRSASQCKLFDINKPLGVPGVIQTMFDDKIKPYINGKIYYISENAFHEEIIKKANETFVFLDNFKIGMRAYAKSYVDVWLHNLLTKYPLTFLRNVLWLTGKINPSAYELYKLIIRDDYVIAVFKNLTITTEMIADVIDCIELNRYVKIKDEKEIEKSEIKKMFGLIKFHNSSSQTFLNYTIRMPVNRIDRNYNFRSRSEFFTFNQRLLLINDYKMFTGGFLFLQESIDSAFAELTTKNVDDLGASIQHVPYSCYVSQPKFRIIGNQTVFFLLLMWLYPFCLTIFYIVYEKEQRRREFLRLMSLRNYVHWIGWAITEFSLMFVISLIVCMIFLSFNVFIYTSSALLVVVMLLYSITLLAQAFLITTLFTNATLASIYSSILYILFICLHLLILKYHETIPSYIAIVLGIFCQTAFANIMKIIVTYNVASTYIGFSNMFENEIFIFDIKLGHSILILIGDMILYFILFWYIDAFYAGKYGLNKPFYYPFTIGYWCPCLLKPDISPNDNFRKFVKVKNKYIEPKYSKLERYVVFDKVTKYFRSQHKYILKDFTAEFYKSQITTILGKKCSGKSQIVQIIAGYDGNYKGNVYINNYKVFRSCLNRDKVGYCPQHNILWQDFTIKDHILIYGMVKNVKFSLIEEYSKKLLREIKINEKPGYSIEKLTNVSKRKLSLLISFIGNPEFVILDEPTIGIKQNLFWDVWKFIESKRDANRCIIVTTNSLLEADMISDEIALFYDGNLQALGSPDFLRKSFHLSYYKIAENLMDNFDKTITEETAKNYLTSLNIGQYDKFTREFNESTIVSIQLFMQCLGEDNEEKLKDPKEFQMILDKNMPKSYQWYRQILLLLIHRIKQSKNSYFMFIGQLAFPTLVVSLFLIFNQFPIFNPLPSMLLHPWLMIHPIQKLQLISFYSANGDTWDKNMQKIMEKIIRTDLGEGGLRCMNESIFQIPNFPCITKNLKNNWSEPPLVSGNISNDCSCYDGFSHCDNYLLGGPIPSTRLMASNDTFLNLTYYNVSDYLLKNYDKNRHQLYGGLDFLHENFFARFFRKIIRCSMFYDNRQFIDWNSKAVVFVNNLENTFRVLSKRYSYLRIWYNNKGFFSAPAYLNIYSNLKLRAYAQNQNIKNIEDYGIAVYYHPIEDYTVDLDQMIFDNYLTTIHAIIYTVCISVVTSSIMVYTATERVNGMKRFKISNGISNLVYWVTMFLYDFTLYLVCVIFFTILCVIFQLSYATSINIKAFILLIILYGIAKITNNYIIAYLFSTPSYGYVTANALEVFVTTFTIIITTSVDGLSSLDPNYVGMQFVAHRIFLWITSFCFSRSLYDLQTSYYWYVNYNDAYNPFDMNIIGMELLSLGILCCGHILIIVIFELELGYKFQEYEKEIVLTEFDIQKLKQQRIIPIENTKYYLVDASHISLNTKQSLNTIVVMPSDQVKDFQKKIAAK